MSDHCGTWTIVVVTAASLGYFVSSRSLLAFIPPLIAAFIALIVYIVDYGAATDKRKFGLGRCVKGTFLSIDGDHASLPGPDDLINITLSRYYGFEIIVYTTFKHQSQLHTGYPSNIVAHTGNLTFRYDAPSGTVSVFTDIIRGERLVQSMSIQQMNNLFYDCYSHLLTVHASMNPPTDGIPRVVLEDNCLYVKWGNTRTLLCDAPGSPVARVVNYHLTGNFVRIDFQLQDKTRKFVTIPLFDVETITWLSNGIKSALQHQGEVKLEN